MAKKEFTYRGLSFEEVQKLSLKDLAELFPARQRRKMKRGFTEQEKKLLKKIKNEEKNIETHCREMIILPDMVGLVIKVHNGKTFVPITIQQEMVGHFLGEFALTRKKIEHSAPGVGATRSSASVAVK